MSLPIVHAELSGLEVTRFGGEEAEWDRFVMREPGCTVCHLAAWRKILSDALGVENTYLVARDDEGNWRGALPLVRVRSRLFGHYLVSMPYLNYGGPVGTPAAAARLADAAVTEARRSRADLLELRSRTHFTASLQVSDRKITVLLDLPESADRLWQDVFPAKLRSQIRRPIKEGMTARFGLEELGAFYDVFARHMRDLGTPVLPRRLFELIAAQLPAHTEIGVVYRGAEPVAGGFGFRWRDEFEVTWAAALKDHNRSAPNMLLYWSFMERMIGLGVGMFNFGRCTPGGGTHRFKQQWGGRDLPLPWRQWSASAVDATPTPQRPLYRVAAGVWQRLPLALTNWAGPALARRIP